MINDVNNRTNKWRESKTDVSKFSVKENKDLPKEAIVARISAKAEQDINVIGEKLNNPEKIEVSLYGQKAKRLVDSGC